MICSVEELEVDCLGGIISCSLILDGIRPETFRKEIIPLEMTTSRNDPCTQRFSREDKNRLIGGGNLLWVMEYLLFMLYLMEFPIVLIMMIISVMLE